VFQPYFDHTLTNTELDYIKNILKFFISDGFYKVHHYAALHNRYKSFLLYLIHETMRIWNLTISQNISQDLEIGLILWFRIRTSGELL